MSSSSPRSRASIVAWNWLIRSARCWVGDDVAVLVGGVDAGGAVAVAFGVVFGECPDEAWAGFAAAAFDDPDECVADVAEVDPFAAGRVWRCGGRGRVARSVPAASRAALGVSLGRAGRVARTGRGRGRCGLTVQPPSWTRRWWRRQSRMRLSSVGVAAVGPVLEVVGVRGRGCWCSRGSGSSRRAL